MLISVALLLCHFTVCVLQIIKKNDGVLAYFIFFQEIHILIFKSLALERFSMFYYIFLIILYIIYNSNRIGSAKTLKRIVLSPIILSITILTVMILIHWNLIGLKSEISYVLSYRYFIHLMPVMIFIILYVNKKETLYELSYGTLLYGVIFFIVLYLLTDIQNIADMNRSDMRDELGLSPIQISRLSGMVLISSIIIFIYKKNDKKRLLYFLIIIASILFMAIGMSRGPFISVVLAFFIMYYFKSNFSFKVIYYTLFISIIVTILSYILIQFEFQIVERFYALEEYESSQRYIRIILFFQYIKDPEMWIIGLGPEGFALKSGIDYAHNYIIEMITEYGLAGFISSLLLIVYGFKYSYVVIAKNESVYSILIPTLFIYYFMAAMVSANIIGNRGFIFVALLLNSAMHINRPDKTRLSI